MPVARAQQRGGGVTAIHVWLIVFVALWLISTVLLVWLYTDQERRKLEARNLRDSNATAQAEMRTLRDSMGRVAELAVGSAQDDDATVAGKVENLYARIRDEGTMPDVSGFDDPTAGLLAGMNGLYETYVGEHQTRVEAEERARNLGEEVERLTADKTERDQAFAQQVDDLVGQVRRLEEDWTNYRQQRDDEIDAVDARIAQNEQESARDIQEQRAANTQLQTELDEYKSRYSDLQAKLGELQRKPSPLVSARHGDGVVLTAKGGEDVVYVNLGRRHQITLGMQFAVYSSDRGIPADGRAKARIEVARVFEHSSECVIREVFGRAVIVEGDVVNNPVYDKDRALTFLVAGRFDFAGVGRAGEDGAERVRALIRGWGGQVVNTLTARVDFVVIGAPPARPSSMEDLSPEETQRQAEIRRSFDAYARAVETAQALSVPVLTQDVFLHFLGYAGQGDA